MSQRHAHPDALFESLEPRVFLSGDDHPDLFEFPLASPLNEVKFFKNENELLFGNKGVIDTPTDTDVFVLTAPGDAHFGAVIVWAHPDEKILAPAVTLLDSTGQAMFALWDGKGGFAGVTFGKGHMHPDLWLQKGEQYYVVVSAGFVNSPGEHVLTGPYGVSFMFIVDSESPVTPPAHPNPPTTPNPQPPGTPAIPDPNFDPTPEDHVDASMFGAASAIPLNQREGAGTLTGRIDDLDDTDLFRFVPTVSGPATVTLTVPYDSQFRGTIRLFDRFHNEIAHATSGIPGTIASFDFQVAHGVPAYVLVEGEPGSTGRYQLNVATTPSSHVLYFPEGFSTPNVDEYIPMINPNPYSVDYTVIAHYETGERDQVIATGRIAPRARDGITITSRRAPGQSLVRQGVGYALEIRSTGPIGATLSHYDFDITTGESFTSRLSTFWQFSEVRREEGRRDFIIWYNPNQQEARITVTLLYENGLQKTFVRTVEPSRRGGISFFDDLSIPADGAFAVRLNASVPIVASLSSYDTVGRRGFGVLGAYDPGATAGIVPAIRGGSDSSISIFNGSPALATVTFEAIDLDTGDVTEHVLELAPLARVNRTLDDLGVPAGANVALRYRSTRPVTVSAIEHQLGDGDAIAAATSAFKSAYYADAFINPAGAGTTYIETLNLFNPTDAHAEVTISLHFTTGQTVTRRVSLGSLKGASIRIDADPAILAQPGPVAFAIAIESDTPIVSSFVHYDLFLNGGWASLPQAIGLTVPVTGMI